MDRIVVKPHKAADLIEQPGGWGLTFHGIALVFWVVTVQNHFEDP